MVSDLPKDAGILYEFPEQIPAVPGDETVPHRFEGKQEKPYSGIDQVPTDQGNKHTERPSPCPGQRYRGTKSRTYYSWWKSRNTVSSPSMIKISGSIIAKGYYHFILTDDVITNSHLPCKYVIL